MNVYSDDLFTLDYDNKEDTLFVELLNNTSYTMDEVKMMFLTIVGISRDYSIRHILLDFSRNAVDMTEAEYKIAFAKLIVGLLPTCIRKLARVATVDEILEHKLEEIIQQILKAVQLKWEVRNFKNKTEAIKWLSV